MIITRLLLTPQSITLVNVPTVLIELLLEMTLRDRIAVHPLTLIKRLLTLVKLSLHLFALSSMDRAPHLQKLQRRTAESLALFTEGSLGGALLGSDCLKVLLGVLEVLGALRDVKACTPLVNVCELLKLLGDLSLRHGLSLTGAPRWSQRQTRQRSVARHIMPAKAA